MTCLKRLNDNLSQTLSDIAALASKTQYFSWNVKGASFYSVHDMLKQHGQELMEVKDKVVTCIFLDGYKHCYAGFKHMAKMTVIHDGNIKQDLNGMIDDLLQSYDIGLVAVEKVHLLALKQGNFAVADLLIQCIIVLKKHMSYLRATQS